MSLSRSVGSTRTGASMTLPARDRYELLGWYYFGGVHRVHPERHWIHFGGPFKIEHYSDLKGLWVDNPEVAMYQFPLNAVTPNSVALRDGWYIEVSDLDGDEDHPDWCSRCGQRK